MNKKTRHDQILELINDKGFVEVSDLSKIFDTSEITIRKDLNTLSTSGKIQRTYGGAKLLASQELPLTERQKKSYSEKDKIAKKANELIKDGDSIFLDAGTTTEHLAQFLTDRSNLVVLTNGLNTATKIIACSNISLHLPEGKVDNKACSLVGTQAEHSLKKYNTRIAFLGVDGITLEQGLMNNSYEANIIAQIMLNNGQTRVILADSSKFGEVGMIKFCDFKDIDILISDSGIPKEYEEAIKKEGVEVIIAD